MTQYRGWLIVFIIVPLLGLSEWSGGAYAQQASTPPGDYGGPFISNPKAQSPEEFKREIRIREEYCRTHPGGACISDQRAPMPVVRHPEEPGYWVTAEPGHLTDCHPDPNNPEKPICVYK
jgi:hypothetical protein